MESKITPGRPENEPRSGTRGNALKVDNTLVAVTQPGSVAAEQYRLLHHRLEQVRATRPLRVVAVSSAVYGEGKSLTAANLAYVAALDGDRRVLLVDADLRRPRIHALLGVAGEPGLADFLEDRVPLTQGVRRPEGTRLQVLPAGGLRGDPAHVAGGAVLRLFLEKVRDHYDEIYVDAPPVLPLADGPRIAGMSDGVVLVIRAGSTSRERVAEALDVLAGASLLGCVLNGVDASEVAHLSGLRR